MRYDSKVVLFQSMVHKYYAKVEINKPKKFSFDIVVKNENY